MNKNKRILEEKQIVLAITGSVGAVEDVKLAHELRRRGAEVQAVMSRAACGIIHPDAVTYATGKKTLTEIGGLVEHVTYCGIGGSADLLLIAPCTANTLCKIAAGIDDTPVTTFATTAIGRGMPIVIVPAMHECMYRHPAVVESIEKVKSWGIVFVDPRIEEDKAKIAGIDEIVLHVERELSGKPLADKKVLITSGPCREPVDDVRVLTTRSSGAMGREIALQAFRLGASVKVVHNSIFPCVNNVHAETADDMREAVHAICKNEGIDFYISAAAISDFAPDKYDGKIPSGTVKTIPLKTLPKLFDEVAKQYRPVSVAFKLGWDAEEKAAVMLDKGADMVIANTPDVMGKSGGSFSLITGTGIKRISDSKEEVAASIWSALL